MAIIRIPIAPDGPLDPYQAAIRATASAYGYALPLSRRINWLLAARNGHIFQGAWDGVSALSGGRIYHRPSPNCNQILIVALCEYSPAGAGYIEIDPSDGAGTAVRLDINDTSATTRWGDPGWFIWVEKADLTSSSLQYHEVDWSDLDVRHLALWEVSRGQLDTATDTMVALRDSAYSGLEQGRMITDGTTGGINDLTAAIASVNGSLYRHCGFLFPTGASWNKISSGSWSNMADDTLGTSTFGLRHKSKMLRSDDTSEIYDGFVWARYTGTGSGDARIHSYGGSDTIPFTSLTNSFDWYTQDSGKLSVDCTAVDTISPECYTSDGTTQVELASMQIVGLSI